AEGIKFKKVYAGKLRRYFSLLNIVDFFKTIIGSFRAIWMIFLEMPHIIIGKGGYASFPVLLAGRLFNIPIIIHESDSVPGKVNKWAGGFAKRVAISFPEASEYFQEEKIALTGVPVRKGIAVKPNKIESQELLNLEKDLPTILVLGGSQGSQKINEIILDSLPELTKSFQIIHQCGKKNEKETMELSKIILEKSENKNRHHLYPHLNDSLIRSSAGSTDLVISRAGGSAIYEIATWNLPSIIIPIKNSAQNHQRENAYSYKKAGACEVIEENNLSSNILISEISRIFEDKERIEKMKISAQKFSKPEASRKIAKEIINLALEHSS
ncbi:glycosyltransferase, partial [Patescibacteria group bacterium]